MLGLGDVSRDDVRRDDSGRDPGTAPAPDPGPAPRPPPTFWSQFGLRACPRFDGLEVLEIGCGRGRRAVEVATHGAAHVLGIDSLPSEIAAACAERDTYHRALADRVDFRAVGIDTLPSAAFDVILSEGAFEHVMDVDAVVGHVARTLAPGGRAYFAFGPLYHSPFGDHGWLRATLPGAPTLSWPWGHLLVPQPVLMRRLQRQRGGPLYRETRDWAYLDLNQRTVDEFERTFRASGLVVRQLATNAAVSRKGRAAARAMDLVGRAWPALRKYLTVYMSVVLERPAR